MFAVDFHGMGMYGDSRRYSHPGPCSMVSVLHPAKQPKTIDLLPKPQDPNHFCLKRLSPEQYVFPVSVDYGGKFITSGRGGMEFLLGDRGCARMPRPRHVELPFQSPGTKFSDSQT